MVTHCAGIVGGIKMNIQNQAKSLEEYTYGYEFDQCFKGNRGNEIP